MNVELYKYNFISLLVIISFFALSSCSKKKEDTSAEYVYTKAMKELKNKNYSESIKLFEEINDNHPLSNWANKGQIMTAYAHYKKEDYDDAIAAAQSFIQNNPIDKNIPYVMYLKSMSYYNRISDITRGQDNTQMASYSFRELIARFPDLDYSKDSIKKLITVDEHLAGATMSIGRYSIEHENYVGAIQNFNKVINRYKHTNQTPEAYYHLAEIYKKIGMKKEHERALSIIENKYQDTKWGKHAKKLAAGHYTENTNKVAEDNE